MGLERIFGDFDARPPTYLIHFKWTFHVNISSPLKELSKIFYDLFANLNLEPDCIFDLGKVRFVLYSLYI